MIKRFEDIRAWKEARQLRTDIWALTRRDLFQRDSVLRGQIRRATHSIMSNIAEGFERDGNAEFLQFLSVAKASAGEVRSHLYAALDEGFVGEAEFDSYRARASQVAWSIEQLMKSLRDTTFRGRKFMGKPVSSGGDRPQEEPSDSSQIEDSS